MAIDANAIRKLLEQFEAKKSKAYYDSKGIITIGIGVNIEDATLPDHLEFVLEQLGIREKVGDTYQIKRLYVRGGSSLPLALESVKT
jgi:GH24 family phage-related lysozyme (muramidase)